MFENSMHSALLTFAPESANGIEMCATVSISLGDEDDVATSAIATIILTLDSAEDSLSIENSIVTINLAGTVKVFRNSFYLNFMWGCLIFTSSNFGCLPEQVFPPKLPHSYI